MNRRRLQRSTKLYMKGNNKITDQAHWDEYWGNYQYDKIPKKVVFKKFMPLLTRGKASLILVGSRVYSLHISINMELKM